MAHNGLTAEQKKFMEECEIEFSMRYTLDDDDYRSIYENDVPPPPIMVPWYGRPKSQARRRFGNRYNNSNYNNEYRDNHDRDRDGGGGDYYSRNHYNNDRRYRPH